MSSQNSQPNPNLCSPTLPKKKGKPLHNLRKDDNHMVLIADIGVALVIIDKDMYIKTCMALFHDQELYHECRDKTKSIHSKLLKQLLDLKESSWTKIQGAIHQTLPSR